MYIRYREHVGNLKHYDLLDDGTVNMTIVTKDNEEIEIKCRESQISIPCIAGNSRLLFQILKENEENEEEE